MKWTMHGNSLFAILLRSPWWISFAIGGAITVVAIGLVPEAYRIFAAVTGFPFLAIGCLAAWKQLKAPSAARIENTLAAVRRMSRDQFSGAVEAAYRRQGYGVSVVRETPANFEITKEGRTALVNCGRWKAAHTGIEALRDLHALKEARNAHECIYLAAGEITESARAFAVKHGIKLIGGPELAQLLPDHGSRKKAR